MSAVPSPLNGLPANTTLHLVSHGKSGGLGCFVADAPVELQRGAAVIVQTVRGLEIGTVVGLGSDRKAKLLGPALAGRLLRSQTSEDAEQWQRQQRLGQEIYERARRLADDLQLAVEILDIDVLFDGSQAIVQFLGEESPGLASLADSLAMEFATDLRFENLSQPIGDESAEEHHEGGCGKPDCGKASGGSCTTCGTGGGCSSCAKGSDVDMAAYFTHLRGKMNAQSQRTPLV